MFPTRLPAPRRHPTEQIPALRWGIVGPGWIADHFANALRWEEPNNRYIQLKHEIEHTAWCIHQGLLDSPLRPLAASLATLSTMDEVRKQIGVVFNEECTA